MQKPARSGSITHVSSVWLPFIEISATVTWAKLKSYLTHKLAYNHLNIFHKTLIISENQSFVDKSTFESKSIPLSRSLSS